MNENMNGQYQNPQFQESMQPQQGGNGLAIVSLVLGILSLVTCCFMYFSLPASIAGLITGILNIKKQNPGKGMAIAGIITSSISLLLAIIGIILVLTIGQGLGMDILKELEAMS